MKGGCGSDDDALSLSIRKLSIDIHTVNHFDVVWMVVSLWSNNDSVVPCGCLFLIHPLTHSFIHPFISFFSFFLSQEIRNKKKVKRKPYGKFRHNVISDIYGTD